MAYIVAQDTTIEAAQTTVDVSIPPGHQANDLILMFIGQDTGATNITTAASGWNLVSGAQAAAQAQRAVVYWRLATSSAEPDVTFTGANNAWLVFTTVVRGADQTTPINAYNKTDSANSTSSSLTSGTVTTTVDGCLVFSFIHFDGTFKLTPQDPSQVTPIFKDRSNTVGLLTFWNQLSASTSTAVQYLSESASEGGTVWTVAIADASPTTAELSPTVQYAYEVVKRYGGTTGFISTDAAFIRHDGITWQTLSNISATSINGTTVLNNAFTEVNSQSTQQPWGTMTGISVAESAIDASGRWVGATHTITSTSFLGRTIHLEFNMNTVTTARFGIKGVILYLEDSSGNWVAHQVTQRQGLIANVHGVFHLDTAYTPFDSGGTIDLTDITRVAFMYHRITTDATAMILRVQNFLLYDKVQVAGGCPGDPLTAGKLQNFFTGHGPYQSATVQGKGQALVRAGIRYGNGSQKSYLDYSANSLETPLSYNSSMARRFWKVNPESDSCEFDILASANDTINFTSCVLATDTRQIFIIYPSSDPSATYNFSGSSLINWLVKNDVMNFNEATFKNCAFILNGGGVDACQIIDCEPMVTDDPSNITDSSFTSPGTGHAIEITDIGTFSFEGNSFSGYGADTTTDAAIYNNSGGLVTLNLGAGDSIPTYRNGTGASTVINTSPIPVTATVLANSRIQLYNVTTTTEIENVFETGTSYSYGVTTEATPGDTIRIRVCKKGYLPFETSAIFTTGGISFLAPQTVDPVYTTYGVDGATVTKFTADYADDEVDLIVATNFSAAEFYNWFNYNLTTEGGVREFYGAIEAIDAGNIIINSSVVDLYFDNTTTDNVFQNDNVRIFRDDDAYPVRNPTSGGGGIDIVWRNQVYVIGLDSVPTTSQIADAVWDEAISGHLTAGSTGATLNDLPTLIEIEASTEIAKEDTLEEIKVNTNLIPAAL